MRATTRPVDELYAWLLGRPDQLEPLYARLHEIGITEPTLAEQTVEQITGTPSTARQWSYRERRKELLLALLDQHADEFDNAVDELGRLVDHLRQVGIRGFVAEHAGDDDFTRPDVLPRAPDEMTSGGTTDEAARAGTHASAAQGRRSADDREANDPRRRSPLRGSAPRPRRQGAIAHLPYTEGGRAIRARAAHCDRPRAVGRSTQRPGHARVRGRRNGSARSSTCGRRPAASTTLISATTSCRSWVTTRSASSRHRSCAPGLAGLTTKTVRGGHLLAPGTVVAGLSNFEPRALRRGRQRAARPQPVARREGAACRSGADAVPVARGSGDAGVGDRRALPRARARCRVLRTPRRRADCASPQARRSASPHDHSRGAGAVHRRRACRLPAEDRGGPSFGRAAVVSCVDALDAHLRAYAEPGADALVFAAPEGGYLRLENFRKRVWAPAVDAAGVAPLRCTTFATRARRCRSRPAPTSRCCSACLGTRRPR